MTHVRLANAVLDLIKADQALIEAGVNYLKWEKMCVEYPNLDRYERYAEHSKTILDAKKAEWDVYAKAYEDAVKASTGGDGDAQVSTE